MSSPQTDGSTMASSTPTPSSSIMTTTIPEDSAASFEVSDEENGGVKIGDGSSNNHSLPNAEELKVSQPIENGSPCSHRTWFAFSAAILLAVVLGLSFGLTADNRNGKASGYPGQSFDPAARAKAKAAMMAYIIDQGVSSEDSLLSTSSPQYKALEFLGDTDLLRLDAPRGGLDTKEGYSFITRYVMTVFYYATKGETWNFDLLFLSKQETCDWYDVFQPPVGQVGVLCNLNTKDIVGLSFISNNLKGTFPSELGVLTTLSYFESIDNEIEGQIPDRLQELTDLRTAVFAYNKLSGSIPEWITQWENLEFLYLSNNLFTSSIPSSFESLKELSVIALDDNALTGSMDFLWQLPKLEYAYLEDNQFTGQMPLSLLNSSPLLINLDLSSNFLSGPLPADLFQLSRMEIMDLHANQFTGPIPDTVNENNQRMQFLALYENQLSSSIPGSLGNFPNLDHLDLSVNQLTGTIPAELDQLTDLTYLFLARNNFTPGPIPTFMYRYSNLRELSLKATQRTGIISGLVEVMRKLVLLDLDDNALSGSIPSQLGTLTDLQYLLLNRNQLSQPVPQQIFDLDKLRFILLDRNNVTGTMEIFCNKGGSKVGVADCQEVQCSCCACCVDGEDGCPDNDLVSNVDPIWERDYQRQFFDFDNSSGFYIAGSLLGGTP